MKRLRLPDISIKRLEPGDEDILADLVRQFRPKDRLEAGVLQSLLARQDHLYLAAMLNRKPVGWAVSYILPRFARNECFLYEIDVANPIRRQGVATALINALQDWARERDISELFVVTSSDNTSARGLYAGSGGKPVADSVLYTWELG